uniref:SCP domain-containing protein n=1 Tax=Mesocestoides corti TaxID=53468 RepID=A0A5K3F1E0_MESCO
MRMIICVLAVIVKVFSKVPSPEERDELIAELTKLREDVQPDASNMNLVSYSEKMGLIADKWVSRCIPDYPSHYSNPEFGDYGFIFSKYPGLPQFKDALITAAKKDAYNFTRNFCTGTCRYYKQAVSAKSTKVGCAKQYCDNNGLGLVACAFNSAERVRGGRPYDCGPSCSKCPHDYSCVHRQCSSMSPESDRTKSALSTTLTMLILYSCN